jgi:Ca-activated chloride channel homolog
MRNLFVFAAALLAAGPVHAAALAIVMAVDVSGSVTPDSYILQRDGIARAFEDHRLVDMIAAVPGGIEALVLEWSDPDQLSVTVDWTWVYDAGSAARFAVAVRATTRSSHGLTAIGSALAAAAAQFDRLPQAAARHVIDISGDGIANIGAAPQAVRDRLVKAGVTINALAILTEEPWLEDYDRDNVIGGSGAFVLVARDFRSFAEAMLRKLAAEVAGAKMPSIAWQPELGGSGEISHLVQK